MKRLKWAYFLLTILIIFLCITLDFRITELKNRNSADRNLIPIVKISLNDVTLEEIRTHDKDIKYEGNSLELLNNGVVDEFSDVEIKGRGNSTWGLPKIPFQIKFNEKEDLLGLGPRKKYIFLANYLDDAQIRNSIMFNLTEMFEQKFRCKGRFVEVYIDDDYQGLYFMTTKVEIGKSSVDLRDKYGVLVELDNLNNSREVCHYSGFGECLLVKDAVFEDDEVIASDAMKIFLDSFNKLEIAAKKKDFETVKELIDVESFVEYFLISEFAVNPDAYYSSYYFYKDGKDDVIHAGPIWDYDFAFGNRKWIWSDDENFYSPVETMIQRKAVFKEGRDSEKARLMYYLIDIPEFRFEVDRVFQEKMSGRKNEFLNQVFKNATLIFGAAMRDDEKWDKDEQNYVKELKYLLDWLEKRYDYFEEEYGKKEWNFVPGVI